MTDNEVKERESKRQTQTDRQTDAHKQEKERVFTVKVFALKHLS